MLSLHLATAPFTFKSLPPGHSPQLPSLSTFGKHIFTPAITDDASQLPVDDRHPFPVAIYRFKGIDSATNNTQRLPFLDRPLRTCKNRNHVRDDSVAPPNTSPTSAVSHSNLAPTNTGTISSESVFPVHGPFDLMYRIQTGGFGSAWAAKDQSTGRLLCIKMHNSLQDPYVSRSVRTELNAFKRMVKSKMGEKGRQFIIELNRAMQHGDKVYFAMELMATDLASYLVAQPERCKLHARRWMAQLALGIQSLHEMAIVHRDMKSENVLIDSRENIRIIDFGLAYLGRDGAKDFSGTVSYMAPEVLRNKGLATQHRQCYSTTVDWWALGCILFELESEGHKILFDTEEDVRAYIAWAQRPYQAKETYARLENLDSVVVDLLDGLLRIEHSARYSWDEIERHCYFLRCDGTSEFDSITVRAIARPIRSELVPQVTIGCEPIMVVEGAKPGSKYDWTNKKWALTNG